MTRTLELGHGCADVVPEYIPQVQDTEAELFAAYLEADTRDARRRITAELGARGMLRGVKAG